MNVDSEKYMERCVHLALQAAGNTGSNPLVGAVLVHNDRIIGEGFHERYGEAHAEVNCLRSVSPDDETLIPDATMYVSLEPCAHFGKTPPCADLIISKRIGKVIIGARDPYAEVDGKGIGKLQAAGVHVETGVREDLCKVLNRRFFTYHINKRPYIVLKWAETADRFIGSTSGRLMISNDLTQRLVHRWRSEEMAIMVGTGTAMADDPQLNVRHWKGTNPVRIVIDRKLRLPGSLKLFDGSVQTIVLNETRENPDGPVRYIKGDYNTGVIAIIQSIAALGINSVLIEGGQQLLQSFIDAGCWDEARVITNQQLFAGTGVSAPVLKDPVLLNQITLKHDLVRWFKNPANPYQLNSLHNYEYC